MIIYNLLDGKYLCEISEKKPGGAQLAGKCLMNADFRRKDLSYADFAGADLTGANMNEADLSYANLTAANMTNVTLKRAVLTHAEMKHAILTGADLKGADTAGASFREADLTAIRDDIWAVLSSSPFEAKGLLRAIRAGYIDGSFYNGECTCLVGTIANIRGEDYMLMDNLKPNSRRPAERFFLGIRIGDRPSNNVCSELAAEWVLQWIKNMESAFGSK